jgi:hypothetical protein
MTLAPRVIAKQRQDVDGQERISNFDPFTASNRREMTSVRHCPAFFRSLFPRVLVALLMVCRLEAGEGTVRTIDGKVLRGEVSCADDARVLVRDAAGGEVGIDLTNVASARFAPGPFRAAGSLLPNGWALRDMGGASGMTRLDDDVFTLRVEGQSTNATAGHFACRPISSDGEVVARVDHVSGTGISLAGVMLRAANGSPIFASLALGADGQIRFMRRPGQDATTSRMTSGATARPPVWLRLQKRERAIVASYSLDGSRWERVGSDTTTWGLQRTWREHQGEIPLLRGSVGVFAASLGRGVTCTARVSSVSLTVDGVLGEYFEGRKWESPGFARIDPRIGFNWRGGAPDPSLERDNFSVRWTGQLLPDTSGEHQFFLDTEGAARFWLNGREIAVGSTKKPGQAGAPVMLRPGVPADLKIEFQPEPNAAAIRLSWSSAAQKPEVISMTNFLSRFAATNAPERVAAQRNTNDLPAVRGIWLRSGTFLAGTLGRGDVSAVRISFGERKDMPVLNSKIARIIFRPQHSVPFEIAQGRTGLFLRDGDFLEGEFQRLEHGSVTVSSVLFGPKRFRSDEGDAAVMVLNDLAPVTPVLRVRLINGSSLNVTTLACENGWVTVHEPLLSRVSFPAGDLFEIERLHPASPGVRP